MIIIMESIKMEFSFLLAENFLNRILDYSNKLGDSSIHYPVKTL